MDTITKAEYKKAKKVVENYEDQEFAKVVNMDNGFGFLYSTEKDFERMKPHRHKLIKAKDINSACSQFLKKAPKTLFSVDYEVSIHGDFIDISERKEFQQYMR